MFVVGWTFGVLTVVGRLVFGPLVGRFWLVGQLVLGQAGSQAPPGSVQGYLFHKKAPPPRSLQ